MPPRRPVSAASGRARTRQLPSLERGAERQELLELRALDALGRQPFGREKPRAFTRILAREADPPRRP
jgi:hypothetical protein